MVYLQLSWLVLLSCVVVINTRTVTKIGFPGCDRSGWKCIKVQNTPIKYEVEYTCPKTNGVMFSLWRFDAPAEIKYLKVINCSSVEIDLTCYPDGRQIERLHLKNIDEFKFINPSYPVWAQIPEQAIFENIKHIPIISEQAFKQMKYPTANVYNCATNTKAVDTIVFDNVHIGTIKQHAFFNLTEVKEFRWNNVNIDIMEPFAVQLEMEENGKFIVENSNFKQLDYKTFSIKSPSVFFKNNNFNELPRNFIESSSYQFDFLSNIVKNADSFAFKLLSQNISFINNNFKYLKTSALQGISPGLFEYIHESFEQLEFVYKFENNTINYSEIGSLHPDWKAYQNMNSYINVYHNKLSCSCRQLSWITSQQDLGELSSMMTFNAHFRNEDNKNLCLQSVTELPISVMVEMYIKGRVCGTYEPLINWCKQYNFYLNDFISSKTQDIISTHDANILLVNNMFSLQRPIIPEKCSHAYSHFDIFKDESK